VSTAAQASLVCGGFAAGSSSESACGPGHAWASPEGSLTREGWMAGGRPGTGASSRCYVQGSLACMRLLSALVVWESVVSWRNVAAASAEVLDLQGRPTAAEREKVT
jgi:hypothetical protein